MFAVIASRENKIFVLKLENASLTTYDYFIYGVPNNQSSVIIIFIYIHSNIE